MVIAGQNVLFCRGPSNGQITKGLIDTGLNLSGLFLYDGVKLRCSFNVCLYMRVSHSGRSNLKIPEILENFDLHGSTVGRQPASIVTLYFLCVSYLFLPTNPVNMNAWARIVQTHQSVKFWGNIGELWKLQGKMSYSVGVHQTARSPKYLEIQR